MGQKVHPTGIRLGIVKDWSSKWYANTQLFPQYVNSDYKVRTFIKKKLKDASVSRIDIERPAKKARISIYTARPGVVIGKKGADIEKLRGSISKMTDAEVHLNIVEIRKPEIDAQLVAENIAQQLERRIAFRRAPRYKAARCPMAGRWRWRGPGAVGDRCRAARCRRRTDAPCRGSRPARTHLHG